MPKKNALAEDVTFDREGTLALLRILDWKPWSGMNAATISDSIERRKADLEGLAATKGKTYAELIESMRRFLGYAERQNAAGDIADAFTWIESFDRYRGWIDGGNRA